jgi:DNA-binding CsgD family transcriptional regulator
MALDLTRRQGDTWHTNWVLFGSGILSWRRGDLAGAERLLRKSLALADGIGDRWLICLSLEGLAWLEESQGRAQRAVCLMSAAEAQWRVNGGALVHPYRLHRDSSMQRARESLDPTTLDTALAKGAAMSLEEALEFALDRRSGPCGETGLTIRETVIARLIAEGLTSRQIAARLHIAERTAEAHTEHIRAKLGFRSRAQVAAWIVQHDRDQRLREELRAQADI